MLAQRSRLMTLLFASGATIPTFTMTCTTTGAQTLTLAALGVATGKTVTVNWGDNSSNAYTGDAQRTHNYAGAGTWTVTMTNRDDIVKLDLRDTKLSMTINAANPMPVNLAYLYLDTLAGLTWTVGASAPMPTGLTSLTMNTLAGLTWTVGASAPMPTGLTYLYLNKLTGLTWTVGASAPMPTGLTSLTMSNLTGLTWTVGASAPMPVNLTNLALYTLAGLTWTVGASAPMPVNLTNLIMNTLAGLTWTVGASAPMPANLIGLTILTVPNIAADTWSGNNAIRTIQWESALSAAAVDAIVAALWANKANFTYATPSLDILGGSNAKANGIYQAASPPTTGMEYIYDLINGAYTSAGPEWTIQYQT